MTSTATPPPHTDIIDQLVGQPSSAALREHRPEARDNAQLSFEALLEPAEPGTFAYAERYAVAAFVTGVSGAVEVAEFYRDLLEDEASDKLVAAVQAAVDQGVSTGPYAAAFPESTPAGFITFDPTALGARLATALDFAHLLVFHPKDASPGAVGHLDAAGWSEDDIVSLSQLIAFLAFQLRVVHGLTVLAGAQPAALGENTPTRVFGTPDPAWAPTVNTLVPDVVGVDGFVNHSLGWHPWVAPLAKEEMSEAAKESLIQPQRIDSEYFRLLARDPAALAARTRTDLDIFYNTDGGLGRAERELAATVVSRLNGCEFCASVHQARSVEEGGDRAAMDRLLFEGVAADLGSTVWDVVREASLALTATPVAFGDDHIAALREVGLDDASLVDLIYSASFFNWANRLMLTLGEPELPKRFR